MGRILSDDDLYTCGKSQRAATPDTASCGRIERRTQRLRRTFDRRLNLGLASLRRLAREEQRDLRFRIKPGNRIPHGLSDPHTTIRHPPTVHLPLPLVLARSLARAQPRTGVRPPGLLGQASVLDPTARIGALTL
jgi:hypothetical protein